MTVYSLLINLNWIKQYLPKPLNITPHIISKGLWEINIFNPSKTKYVTSQQEPEHMDTLVPGTHLAFFYKTFPLHEEDPKLKK